MLDYKNACAQKLYLEVDVLRSITLGSLFDGVAGFPCVASWYGIEPVWASEIEAAPMRIASRHFPNMKQLGDITKLHGDKIDPVDIITLGSPCTNVAICGDMTGISVQCDNCGSIINAIDHDGMRICGKCGSELHLTQSGLFLEAIRVIREMRESTNECFPKIVLFENVRNILSSNGGNDFYIVIREFCNLMQLKMPLLRPTKWEQSGEILGDNSSLAWRVMDAKYWGVPQHRCRVFLVADFRGKSASEILFKQKKQRRHHPKIKLPWERYSGEVDAGINQTNTGCNTIQM